MSKYYCPYCNSKYQFIAKNNAGKLICGLCEEEMIKKSFINIKQIVSLIIVITFILPLFYSLLILIIDRKQFKEDIYQSYKNNSVISLNFSSL